MRKPIKNLFRDNLFIIAIIITLSICYLSLMRMPKSETNLAGIDKFYHLFAYFTLAICWLFSFYKKPNLKYVIVLLCIIFGILIEVMQEILTVYRTGDYKDVIANTFGILLGLLVFNQILKKISIN